MIQFCDLPTQKPKETTHHCCWPCLSSCEWSGQSCQSGCSLTPSFVWSVDLCSRMSKRSAVHRHLPASAFYCPQLETTPTHDEAQARYTFTFPMLEQLMRKPRGFCELTNTMNGPVMLPRG